MDTEIRFVTNKRKLQAHRKSRLGCYRCKTKRIKCSEGRPQCSGCLRNIAQCVYPSDTPPSIDRTPTPPNALQVQHPGFHLHDMRFFHDFMTVSWPHLPLERDGAWLHEIPILAQQHDFLMHGILSLGASHLHAKTNLEMKGHVHRHRTLAMRGLNSIAHKHDARDGDTDDHSTGSRLTATLATSYLLTFTASYMGDPFNMFLVLVRACASITTEIVKRGFPSPLLPSDQRSIAATPHLEVMRKRLSNAPSLPRDEVERGLESLSKVEDQCPMLPFQRDMLSTMKVVLANVQEPYEAYCHFVDIYTSFTAMPSEEFEVFTDCNNVASVVLQAHFLAIEALIQPWLLSEFDRHGGDGRRNATTALPSSAVLCNDPPFKKLLAWPLQVLPSKAGTLACTNSASTAIQ